MNKLRSFSLRGFTLIELLVVIAVMAVLLSLTIPAFQGMGRGSKLRTSVFQVNTTLSLARQLAITTRQDVSVVFPDKTLTYTTNNLDLAYTGYGVYAQREKMYVGEWRKLPSGVVFSEANEHVSSGVNILEATTAAFKRNIPFHLMGNTPQDVKGLTFRPDGAFGGTIAKGIYVTEGFFDPVTKQTVQRPDSFVMGLELNAVTGQSRVRRYPEDE